MDQDLPYFCADNFSHDLRILDKMCIKYCRTQAAARSVISVRTQVQIWRILTFTKKRNMHVIYVKNLSQKNRTLKRICGFIRERKPTNVIYARNYFPIIVISQRIEGFIQNIISNIKQIVSSTSLTSLGTQQLTQPPWSSTTATEVLL